MKKCKFCGSDLADGIAFCSTCGAMVEQTPTFEAELKSEPDTEPQKRELSAGMLVWSIINTLLGACTCASFILGIAGIIFTILAKFATSDKEEKQHLKIAKILNLVATAFTLIIIISFISISLFGLAASEQFYYFLYQLIN